MADSDAVQVLTDWAIVAVTVVAAVGGVAVAQRVLKRRSRDQWTPLGAMVTRCTKPAYLLAGLLGVHASLRAEMLPEVLRQPVSKVLDLLLIAAISWMVVRALQVLTNTWQDEVATDHGHASPRARQIRTQMMLIRRVVAALGLVVGGALMLFQFEPVRALGHAALASAGIAGIVAGIAAREALGNLFAGFQVAFSELVTVEDVVEVEEFWGQVEEVTLQYVVVRIWDERRLVVPVSYFVQTPFRNLSSRDERMIGTVYLYVDWRVPVEELRRELDSFLHDHALWDGQVGAILLTDVTQEGLVELRVTASSADAFTIWELQCAIREHLVTYIRENYPNALPRHRIHLDPDREGPRDSAPAPDQ